MKTIIEYWFVIVATLAIIGVCICQLMRYFKLPSETQLAKVKEWLVWACIEAEASLSTGTGQAKLRKVYDAFITIPSFTWIAQVISFEKFSALVDSSLEKAKLMIVNSPELANYVYGDSADDEVAKLKSQLKL